MKWLKNLCYSPRFSYELFVFVDGGQELWKTDRTGKLFPQTRYMNSWVSDLGFGDYSYNKKLAKEVLSVPELELDSILVNYVHFDELSFRKDLGHPIKDVVNKS